MARTDDRLSITLPSELKEEFVKIAQKNKRSLVQEASIAIEEHIKREKMVAVPHTELSPEQDADVEGMVRSLIEKVLAEKGL